MELSSPAAPIHPPEHQTESPLVESWWVWRSSDDSIAKRQVSMLAVAEVPVAILLFWWVAHLSPWPWMTMVGFIAAPFLLLRSPQSIEIGVRMLSDYCNDVKSLSTITLGILSSLPLVCATLYLTRSSIVIELPAIYSMVICSAAVSTALAFSFFNWKKLGYATASVVIVNLTFLYVMYGSNSVKLFVANFAVIVLAVAMLAYVVDYCYDKSLDGIAISGAAVMPLFVFGVFVRAIMIRMTATICEARSGLHYFSQNWQETVLYVDFCHAPTLIPRAETVNERFSFSHLLNDIESVKDISSKAAFFVIGSFIYIPAIIYRWNIKASSWLWWPLVVALHHPGWLVDKTTEETMRTRIAVHSKLVLLLFWPAVIVLVLWLADPLLPSAITQAIKEWKSVADALPAAPHGVQRAVLWMAVGTLTMLWYSAFAIRAAHAKALEGAKDYESYGDELKLGFKVMAVRLHLWKCCTYALAALSLWLYLLWWALQTWPDLRFLIWDWLQPWLSPNAIL
jgi:hypothetical protein